MIRVNEFELGSAERQYVLECIETGWISSEGPFVKRLEDEMAAFTGRRYAVSVANGTAALDIAVRALGISEGDEVIIPTFTIISCASAVINSGGIPVVVDCCFDTWNMDVEQIEAKITSKTKAIMMVHIYGLPVDIQPVLDLAEKYNLNVIEDAAQAIGLEYKGRQCGSFGDVSTFSFYPNKHVTTGEGGMVLMDSEIIYEKCKSLRNLCFNNERRFVHHEIGWNYRLSNIQAAIGVAQVERLSETVRKKRWIGQLYNEAMRDLDWVHGPVQFTDYADNIYWVYGVVVKDEYESTAAEVMDKLRSRGVDTRPFFFPMNKQPALQKRGLFKNVSCPNAERIAEKGFYLPSGLAMTEEKIAHVVRELKNLFEESMVAYPRVANAPY